MHTKNGQRMDRREFLKSGGAVLGGLACAPLFVTSRALGAPGRTGANERLTLGIIGVGGRGTGNLKGVLALPGIDVAAVCDVDEGRLAKARALVPGAKPYRDYRHILERKDIDAVLISTPDHWHGVQTVHACECGKHVYVEKPAHCTIEEGKAMAAAAKNNKVCVQVGSQGRAQEETYKANLFITNGAIGQVRKIVCWHYASPADVQPLPDGEPPADLDWDLWLGPLRWRPYNPRYCPGTFRWLMESGGGQIRDRGAHVMSVAMHIMKADHTGPVSVSAKGTAPASGLWDTAMEMEVVYEFKNPDWTLSWNQPGQGVPYFDKKFAGKRDRYGAVYHGDKDQLVVWGGDGGTFTEPKALSFEKPSGGVDVPKAPEWNNYLDWIEGIRTGRKTIMDIEAGVAVANLCVLGNLSFILGRKLEWDPVKQEIIGDEQARRLMSRPQRYPYVI